MSTGAKVGLGIGLGCGVPILLLVMLIGCAALFSSTAPPPSAESSPTEEPASSPSPSSTEEETEEPEPEPAVDNSSLVRDVDDLLAAYEQELVGVDGSYEYGDWGRHGFGKDAHFEPGEEEGHVRLVLGEDSLQADAAFWQSLTLEIACEEVDGLVAVEVVTETFGELDAETC